MKYIKTFNNHETYEQNLQVDYPTLSHCQTEEHIHLTPKYFITYKADEMIPGGYDLLPGSFGDARIVNHIFNENTKKGVIIFDQPLIVIPANTSAPFYNSNLAIELDLPNTLEEIGNFFSLASRTPVKRLIFRSINPPILNSSDMFDMYQDEVTHAIIRYPNLKIYVPDESVDAYKATTNWSAYADIIFPISQLSQDQEEDEEEED